MSEEDDDDRKQLIAKIVKLEAQRAELWEALLCAMFYISIELGSSDTSTFKRAEKALMDSLSH